MNGSPISTSAFDELARDNRFHLEQAQRDTNGALTHFEALTALAYKHFQEQQVCLMDSPSKMQSGLSLIAVSVASATNLGIILQPCPQSFGLNASTEQQILAYVNRC